MDPNEALRLAREAAGELVNADDDDAFTSEGTNLGQLVDAFEALDGWLKMGGFLPQEWERSTTLAQVRTAHSIEEHLYEKCRDCHLFVEPNSGHVEGDDIAPYVHLARDNAGDQHLDDGHEPVPSGMKANLNTWRVFGPVAMRERFVTPDQWSNY